MALQAFDWDPQFLVILPPLLHVVPLQVQQIPDLFHVALDLYHWALVGGVVWAVWFWKHVLFGSTDIIAQFDEQLLPLFLEVIDSIFEIFIELVYLLQLVFKFCQNIAVA